MLSHEWNNCRAKKCCFRCQRAAIPLLEKWSHRFLRLPKGLGFNRELNCGWPSNKKYIFSGCVNDYEKLLADWSLGGKRKMSKKIWHKNIKASPDGQKGENSRCSSWDWNTSMRQIPAEQFTSVHIYLLTLCWWINVRLSSAKHVRRLSFPSVTSQSYYGVFSKTKKKDRKYLLLTL